MKQIEKETMLEFQILKWFCLKYPEISGQIKTSIVTRREYSGAGFFFELSVSKNAIPLDKKIKTLDGPQIKSSKLDLGGGSVFFLKNGYLKILEIYAYGKSFPEKLDEFELHENDTKFSTHDTNFSAPR